MALGGTNRCGSAGPPDFGHDEAYRRHRKAADQRQSMARPGSERAGPVAETAAALLVRRSIVSMLRLP